jgi:hypothetical protein
MFSARLVAFFAAFLLFVAGADAYYLAINPIRGTTKGKNAKIKGHLQFRVGRLSQRQDTYLKTPEPGCESRSAAGSSHDFSDCFHMLDVGEVDNVRTLQLQLVLWNDDNYAAHLGGWNIWKGEKTHVSLTRIPLSSYNLVGSECSGDVHLCCSLHSAHANLTDQYANSVSSAAEPAAGASDGDDAGR